MMRFILNFFGKNPIVQKDKLSGGYIAYYKHDKGIVAQGVTQEEALGNLKEDINTINEFKKNIKRQKEYSSGPKQSIAHS